MDERSRHDRTVRLLETRLEALARASERAPLAERRYEREIGAVFAATRHAVTLALISTEEADAICPFSNAVRGNVEVTLTAG